MYTDVSGHVSSNSCYYLVLIVRIALDFSEEKSSRMTMFIICVEKKIWLKLVFQSFFTVPTWKAI